MSEPFLCDCCGQHPIDQIIMGSGITGQPWEFALCAACRAMVKPRPPRERRRDELEAEEMRHLLETVRALPPEDEAPPSGTAGSR